MLVHGYRAVLALGMKSDTRPEIGPRHVGVDTAARMTDMSVWTWRKYAYTGRIASVKIGKRLLIPLAEVERVLAEGLRPAL